MYVGGDVYKMEKQYTIKEVCKILGVTRQCLYHWERSGKISFTRVNGLPRISESELKRIVKEWVNGKKCWVFHSILIKNYWLIK